MKRRDRNLLFHQGPGIQRTIATSRASGVMVQQEITGLAQEERIEIFGRDLFKVAFGYGIAMRSNTSAVLDTGYCDGTFPSELTAKNKVALFDWEKG